MEGFIFTKERSKPTRGKHVLNRSQAAKNNLDLRRLKVKIDIEEPADADETASLASADGNIHCWDNKTTGDEFYIHESSKHIVWRIFKINCLMPESHVCFKNLKIFETDSQVYVDKSER